MADTFDTIAAAYAEFQRSADRAKDTARDAYQRAYDEAVHRDLQAFSRRLQQAHASGLTKGELRKATRKHNNNQAFKDLYDAYTPFEGEFERFVPKNPEDEWTLVTYNRDAHPETGEQVIYRIDIRNAEGTEAIGYYGWKSGTVTPRGRVSESARAFFAEFAASDEAKPLPAFERSESEEF